MFKPIVELFPIAWSNTDLRAFLDEEQNEELIKALRQTRGLYSFYNSELEIIYVGKTTDNFWNQMRISFNRMMPHHLLYTTHSDFEPTYEPKSKFKPIKRRQIYLWEAAKYFSAYQIDDEDLIPELEKLLIRMMPNDVVNVRMEGNTSLSNFELPAD